MNALTTFDPETPEGRAAIRQRHDGWTPDKQRPFLEAVARGFTVEQACRFVGMSPSSAYAFRNRAAGAAFALGWRAANLLAREHIADALLARAIDGQVETTTRPDGSTVSRHRYDNRLAVTMLRRLDAQAEDSPAADHRAARLIAQDWEAYCDGLERDDGPLRAGLFVGLRAAADERDGDLSAMVQLARADRFRRTGAGLAAEVDIADLDPAQRAGWTAEQWVRAEAAGLLALAPAPAETDDAPGSPCSPLRPTHADDIEEEEEHIPVWEEDDDEWMTSFPPPPGFDGYQVGRPGDLDYKRELTEEEAFVVKATRSEDYGTQLRRETAERDRWFVAASMRLVAPGEPYDPAALDEAAARAAAAEWPEDADADADVGEAAAGVGAGLADPPGTPFG